MYARKLVGCAMSEAMPQELTLQALELALGWRDPGAGLVHHSDRGSQYAANDYRRKFEALGITVSMSGKWDCWDNAPMESVAVGALHQAVEHFDHLHARAQDAVDRAHLQANDAPAQDQHALALSANAAASTGAAVHVVTVNDYLAERVAVQNAPLFEFLGLSVGVIKGDMDLTQRRAQYACDVV